MPFTSLRVSGMEKSKLLNWGEKKNHFSWKLCDCFSQVLEWHQILQNSSLTSSLIGSLCYTPELQHCKSIILQFFKKKKIPFENEVYEEKIIFKLQAEMAVQV